MTGIDIISGALRLINVIAAGEVPDNESAQDALEILNGMLDAWGLERLMVFNVTRQVFTLNAGQQTYPMGLGATTGFNVARPVKISRAGIICLNNAAQPLELPIDYTNNEQKWSEIPVKNIASALPTFCYDDNAFPYRNINLYPVPNVPVQLALYTWSLLGQIPNLTQDNEFPPGYYEAIKYNLAVRLSPEFGNPTVDPVIVQFAMNAKAVVKSINIPILEMRCDPALVSDGRIFNWLTGR